MPASRSRTERWRECLAQIEQRQGGIELTLPVERTGADVPVGARGKNLLWRVRLLRVADTELIVERPTALGHAIDLEPGLELVGVMAIGQNRWTFKTRTLGHMSLGGSGRPMMGLRLGAPEGVERCRRREHDRYSLGDLSMPPVQGWAVLDPTSVVAAEVACQATINEAREAAREGRPYAEPGLVLPEVGPGFTAQLTNIGGGGAGLVLPASESSGLDRGRVLYLRVDLMPHVPAPLGVTARIVHQHLDSGMNIHAGVCFDFSFNPGHKEFVSEQIRRYVGLLQASQATRVRKAA